jgi:hypothetical protein
MCAFARQRRELESPTAGHRRRQDALHRDRNRLPALVLAADRGSAPLDAFAFNGNPNLGIPANRNYAIIGAADIIIHF